MRITMCLICLVVLCGMVTGCAKQDQTGEAPPAATELAPAAEALADEVADEATAVKEKVETVVEDVPVE